MLGIVGVLMTTAICIRIIRLMNERDAKRIDPEILKNMRIYHSMHGVSPELIQEIRKMKHI